MLFRSINTLVLMRGATGVQLRMPDRFDAYLKAVFTALWVEQKNLNDPAVLMATLAAAGFEPAAMQALVAEPDPRHEACLKQPVSSARTRWSDRDQQ